MQVVLNIPKGRRKVRAGRLCVLLGLTGLLFLMIALRFGEAADAIHAAEVNRR